MSDEAFVGGDDVSRNSEDPTKGVRSGVARVGGENFKLVHDSIKPTGLVSPLRRQICLNPVWLGGLWSSASLRSPSDSPVSQLRSGGGLGAGALSGVWGGA